MRAIRSDWSVSVRRDGSHDDGSGGNHGPHGGGRLHEGKGRERPWE